LLIDHTVILSLHQAGIVFEISVLLFHAETIVNIQLSFASVIASHTALFSGFQVHPKLIFRTLIQLFLA
jgi:hypothetical protein